MDTLTPSTQLSSELARRKKFGDEIAAVITRHYAEGLTCIEVAAFLAHQAHAALDQVDHRMAYENSAHRKLEDAVVLIALDFPGWSRVTYEPIPPRCVAVAKPSVSIRG